MDANKYKRAQWAATIIQAAYRGFVAKRTYKRQQAALQTIQAHARGWYTRRKVKQLRERAAYEHRFDAAMERHRQRIYLLELEKREILAVPAAELEEWQARRHRAAMMVQAHWRGLVQRRKWGQRSPERLRREQAALTVQRAFKQMMAQQRASKQQTPPGSPASDPAASSRLAAMRPDQSGTVLMGSPQQLTAAAQAEAEVEADVRASMRRRQAGPASYIGSKRYQDLMRQVEGRLAAYKANAKHQRQDPRVVEARLGALMRGYTGSAEANIHAAHQRQAALSASEALAAQLDASPALSALPPGAQPADFPRPARGSERGERAATAHALLLAEVRAGTRWWKHLHALNHAAVQRSVLEEASDRWHGPDQQWRRQWLAIQAEEAGREDPDTGLHRVVPPLSDLAISDEQDQQQRQRRWVQAQDRLQEGAMASLAQRGGAGSRRTGGEAHGPDHTVGGAGGLERIGSIPVIVVPTAAPAMVFRTPPTTQQQQQQAEQSSESGRPASAMNAQLKAQVSGALQVGDDSVDTVSLADSQRPAVAGRRQAQRQASTGSRSGEDGRGTDPAASSLLAADDQAAPSPALQTHPSTSSSGRGTPTVAEAGSTAGGEARHQSALPRGSMSRTASGARGAAPESLGRSGSGASVLSQHS